MAVSDILVSPVRILRSPTGTTLPADSLAAGGAWPAGWTEFGYTKTPLSVEYAFESLDYDIQESLAAVGRTKIKEELKIETTLAEYNLTNLDLAWDAYLSLTSSGSGVTGKEELTLGDQPEMEVLQWGFEGSYVSAAGNTHPFRVIVWKATSEVGGKLEFGKADTTGIPLKLAAISDMTKSANQRLVKFVKITAPAT
jgi:hypothetical protein